MGECAMGDSSIDRSNKIGRREFNRLSLAAMGGLATGASMIPGSLPADEEKKTGEAPKKELHVCRGLNSCKAKGAAVDLDGDGKPDINACAGRGACATVKHTSCAGQNQCKGLGGCGENVANNACKGQGSCHIPLHEGPWKAARARFEAKMKKEKKKFGNPPPIEKTPQGKSAD
jgi:hypothetical protein